MFTCNSVFRLHALQDYLKSCRYFRRQYFAWESVCLNSVYNFLFYLLSLYFLQLVFPLSLLSSCLVIRSLRYVLLILTLILILLSLQSVVNLSLSQNCPPLLSILLLTSPVPHAHLNSGFPTPPLPSDLRKVSSLQQSRSCILKSCPSHLTLLAFITLTMSSSPGSSVGIVTELRTLGSGIESRRGRDFPSVQTGPGAHPASCKMGTGSFLGVKCGRGVLLTTHPLLVQRSWKSRAILLPTFLATPWL